MKGNMNNIVPRFTTRWRTLLWIELLTYAIAAGVFVHLLVGATSWGLCTFAVVFVIVILIKKPWTITDQRSVTYIDNKLPQAEHSASLLLANHASLSPVAQLQLRRTYAHLGNAILHPPHKLFVALGIVFLASVAGWTGNYFIGRMTNKAMPLKQQKDRGTIALHASDSIGDPGNKMATITAHRVYIDYPDYTGLSATTSAEMNIEAPEGSRVTWKLSFDRTVEGVVMEYENGSFPLAKRDSAFYRSMKLNKNSFYNFKITDSLERTYVTELFSLTSIPDRGPAINILDLDQYTSFEVEDEKSINFTTIITDDYGVSDAYIVATVSQGSGESVKFREEKLLFEDINGGGKEISINKQLNLEAMDMAPGDELYFYIEALDNKLPVHQVVRSETYFAVIKDTTANDFAVEGSLGVDIMPAYFRSQRQIIIDSEKLLKEKPNIPEKEFNSRSNELAFDQKALRLKYGQFMGEEAGSGLAVSPQEQVEAMREHQEGSDSADPLKEYTHDHDGSNEHNLVPDEHDNEPHEDAHDHSENNLEAYTHNHDNTEEATFFTLSTKAKLRQALSEMWNAELYLRLFDPAKSLPYQYQALKIIKEIKNDARIYVHRIGFDPPPIKEENRLSGDIDEVANYSEQEQLAKDSKYPALKLLLARLRVLIDRNQPPNDADRRLFKSAGNELAEIAIQQPGKYLNALQYLNLLANNSIAKENMFSVLGYVQAQTTIALPEPITEPELADNLPGKLDVLMINELNRQSQ